MLTCNFGHAGDGNLHIGLCFPGQPNAVIPEEAKEAVTKAVVSLEGRIAAEHGIGCLKASRMHWNIDGPTLELSKNLKKMLDPKGILNPDKVLP
jgi:FAD/FMN-containing dehydrogenase